MSPEQARGEPVDARSDLFSLGAVIYEMVTGHRAFPGSVPAVVFDAILNQAPVPPQVHVPGLPASLVSVLRRAMAKAPADRYQSGAALRDDLVAVRDEVLGASGVGQPAVALHGPVADTTPFPEWGSGPRPAVDVGRVPVSDPHAETASVVVPASRRRRRALAWVGAAVVALAAAAAAGLWLRNERTGPLTERDSVVLGDFVNATGDPVFDASLREALAVQLDQSPFLNVLATERIAETVKLMGRDPVTALSHEATREACERLNAKALIEGTIRRLGEHYVLSASATGCATGDTLAIQQTEVERKEDVLKGLGGIATELRRRLGESLSTIESFTVPIEQATTPSLEALKAYSLGRQRRAQGAEIESVPFLERAVELDPHFATAWNELSLVYGNLGESVKGAEFGAKAYAERERVSERERLAITYQYHDRVTGELSEAITALELWKRLYPRDYRPANSLAVAFNRMGNYERAMQEALEAMRRAPDQGLVHSNLAFALRGLNRFDEARAAGNEAVTRKIETLPTRRLLFQLAVLRGDTADADRQLAWAEGRARGFDLIGAKAQVEAHRGRWTQARELYRTTVDMARAAGLTEVGDAYAAQAAWSAAVLGHKEEARSEARRLLNASPQVALVAAAALAQAGDSTGVMQRIDEVLKASPRDTQLADVLGPVARGTVLIAHGRPKDAIAGLRRTVPYDYGRMAGLSSLYVRGLALAAAGDHAAALAEFTRLHEHRGAEPFAIFDGVAALERARAAARAGNTKTSAQVYDEFLQAFAQADADLPLLQTARTERAALDAASSASR